MKGICYDTEMGVHCWQEKGYRDSGDNIYLLLVHRELEEFNETEAILLIAS